MSGPTDGVVIVKRPRTPRTPALPTVDGPACPAAAAARAMLRSCAELVELLDDAAYRRPSRVLVGGTIGRHVRHCVDHFAAALGPVLVPGSVIDYDHRERDVPMETDRAEAIRQIAALAGRLERLSAAQTGGDVVVRVMPAPDGATIDLESSLARELVFAAHHAVHHHAMIRAIAEEFGHPPPESFGKAPSTIHYERSRAVALAP